MSSNPTGATESGSTRRDLFQVIQILAMSVSMTEFEHVESPKVAPIRDSRIASCRARCSTNLRARLGEYNPPVPTRSRRSAPPRSFRSSSPVSTPTRCRARHAVQTDLPETIPLQRYALGTHPCCLIRMYGFRRSLPHWSISSVPRERRGRARACNVFDSLSLSNPYCSPVKSDNHSM